MKTFFSIFSRAVSLDFHLCRLNLDNVPVQELITQPFNQPISTLFLDVRGSTDDGQQYGVEHIGAEDATVQALNAMEAGSAGEYISKTVGSIGTVNHQLWRHEHEILVNEHLGIENKVAVGEILEDIKTKRGNLWGCQKFVVGLDKDVKTIHLDGCAKNVQKDVKTVQNNFEAVQQELKTKIKMLQDQKEMVWQEIQVQRFLIQSTFKKTTGGDDDEIDQINQPLLEAL
ncbi:hypothetical protein UCDDA912_g06616 [Diaporthe ampelina]|uniref:Uncharacterized protein n=1 Tax=Diaporthe ampelina TaxID=1214573 RepID=A0A0G2HE63_9PEZI|nr:hypothetical protein UCDDA912_g06616 [Diaporthe ampelina]